LGEASAVVLAPTWLGQSAAPAVRHGAGGGVTRARRGRAEARAVAGLEASAFGGAASQQWVLRQG